MTIDYTKKAIEAAGGPVRLGLALGITSQAISQWRVVPAKWVNKVSDATSGVVKRSSLRPDLYPAAQERPE